MLTSELSGVSINKSARRRALLPLLRGRTEGSVEFKRANISAALIELGFPYLSGYEPRSNYQTLLFDILAERLAGMPVLHALAAEDADREVVVPDLDDILARLTAPPKRRDKRQAMREPKSSYRVPRIFPIVNYLEREAHNRQLGLAGEEFVLRFEQARLLAAGRDQLASKIEHISRTHGDGHGYDIQSFEETGADRLIEVKTTKYGAETPFFVSRNEVSVSEMRSSTYQLYRVYEFREGGRLFALPGALSRTCALTPDSYVASVA
ncbi:MAG TPA: DUF3883 domain-containing protein [Gemmatimonadaceae bacterium]|nr:DUF3883 domain-containing protein [Gemmatimonadaceae bacterium]